MDKSNLTIGIISRNASKSIKRAIQSASWAEELILLDDSSTDDTLDIAKSLGVNVYSTVAPNFAAKRNELMKKTHTDWLFYLDSDEIITPTLRQDILQIITTNQIGAYRVARDNYFLGRKMYPDRVDRLFHKNTLITWHGDLHESPKVKGSIKDIKSALIHHTHTDITSMLEKTNKWSEFEANLRIEANHPPIFWWRLIRIAMTVWWQQFVHLQVGKFGRQGLFEGYFQIIDKLIVYTKVWERQQK